MHTVETQFGGRRLSFETGRLAQQGGRRRRRDLWRRRDSSAPW